MGHGEGILQLKGKVQRVLEERALEGHGFEAAPAGVGEPARGADREDLGRGEGEGGEGLGTRGGEARRGVQGQGGHERQQMRCHQGSPRVEPLTARLDGCHPTPLSHGLCHE